MAQLQVVVGGQYGSEAKGAVSAFLSRTLAPLVAVRVAGPNAGHTVIGRCPPRCPDSPHGRPDTAEMWSELAQRHPWRLRQIPVAAVTNPNAMLVIAPGSEVDPAVLRSEVTELESALLQISWRLLVDATATVIEARHQAIEQTPIGSVPLDEYERYLRADEATRKSMHIEMQPSLVSRIGSTGKGIGAARADRAMRRAHLASECSDLDPWTADAASVIRGAVASPDQHVLIEGTQGYALGQHAGHYPQCTSSDCTASDMLAMAGVAPWSASRLEIWVVFRSYPIRVAGDSGPLKGETTWSGLGLPEEHTTVTRKVRRVGAWDARLARRALSANGFNSDHHAQFGAYSGPVRIAMMMADYLVPEIACQTSFDRANSVAQERLRKHLSDWEYDLGLPVSLAGTGSATIMDLRGADVTR